MSAGYREVTLITMKRDHIHKWGEDKYGHWWFVIGDELGRAKESYGWWPSRQVGAWDTLGGVPGLLNGVGVFIRGTPTRDPNHFEIAEEEFHPLVAEDDPRTDDEIAECLRAFARSYSGEWRWTFGAGQNCQTFQIEAMKHCGLHKRRTKKYA